MLILDLYPFCTPPEMTAPFKQVSLFLAFFFVCLFFCLFLLRRWFSRLKTLQINLKVIKLNRSHCSSLLYEMAFPLWVVFF